MTFSAQSFSKFFIKLLLNTLQYTCYKNRYILLFSIMIFNTSVFANYDGATPLINTYNENEFLFACRTGNKEVVERYCNEPGFDVNQILVTGKNKTPIFGLYLAAQEGHLNIVTLFTPTKKY